MDDEHKIQIEGVPLLPEDQRTVLKGYERDMVRHVENVLSVANKSLQSNPQTLRAATMSAFGMLNWFYMWNTHKDADARAAYARTVATITIGGVPALGQL